MFDWDTKTYIEHIYMEREKRKRVTSGWMDGMNEFYCNVNKVELTIGNQRGSRFLSIIGSGYHDNYYYYYCRYVIY